MPQDDRTPRPARRDTLRFLTAAGAAVADRKSTRLNSSHRT